MRTQDAVESFHMLENSQKLCRGFHQARKAMRTRFISFLKLLFSDLKKEKDNTRRAYVYSFISFMKL